MRCGGFAGLPPRGPGPGCSTVDPFTVDWTLNLTSHRSSATPTTNNTSVSLAVSHFNEVNFQLFRLDASGTLFFSQAVNSTWQAVPDAIALTVKPKPNSPIGLVSWSPSGVSGDTSVCRSQPSARWLR